MKNLFFPETERLITSSTGGKHEFNAGPTLPDFFLLAVFFPYSHTITGSNFADHFSFDFCPGDYFVRVRKRRGIIIIKRNKED